MTVFELHLAVNQRLQEVGSFKRNKYFPEEIDMALNKAAFRLLEKGVKDNFQGDQINLSTVSALIKKNSVSDVFLPQPGENLYEENMQSVYALVPTDLYWTINTRTEGITDPLVYQGAPTLPTLTISEYVAPITFPAPNGSAPFYPALTITSSIQGVLYTAPVEIAGGMSTEPGKYIILGNVLEKYYRNTTTGIYWERYRDTYYPKQFIVVSDNPLGNVSISATGCTTLTTAAVLNTYTGYDRTAIAGLPSKTVKITTSRISQQSIAYQALTQNIYYNTSINEPVISQDFDFFTIYYNKSFLVTRLYTDYIRKPRTISLSLNQNCELDDTTHQKLVDLAVEILRLDTKDQAYVETVKDTELRS
jgi:hypothetical protein